MRLFRSKGTWLALLAASAAPLVGYGLYQPAGGGTTAALVLLNPMLTGALGGACLLYTSIDKERHAVYP